MLNINQRKGANLIGGFKGGESMLGAEENKAVSCLFYPIPHEKEDDKSIKYKLKIKHQFSVEGVS